MTSLETIKDISREIHKLMDTQLLLQDLLEERIVEGIKPYLTTYHSNNIMRSIIYYQSEINKNTVTMKKLDEKLLENTLYYINT